MGMVREKTCASCKNLQLFGSSRNGFYGCNKTGEVVPHEFNGGEGWAKFWRIPMNCPRLNSEVEKSSVKIPEKEWEIISIVGGE